MKKILLTPFFATLIFLAKAEDINSSSSLVKFAPEAFTQLTTCASSMSSTGTAYAMCPNGTTYSITVDVTEPTTDCDPEDCFTCETVAFILATRKAQNAANSAITQIASESCSGPGN